MATCATKKTTCKRMDEVGPLRFSLVAKQMMKKAKPPSEAGRFGEFIEIFPASWFGWLDGLMG